MPAHTPAYCVVRLRRPRQGRAVRRAVAAALTEGRRRCIAPSLPCISNCGHLSWGSATAVTSAAGWRRRRRHGARAVPRQPKTPSSAIRLSHACASRRCTRCGFVRRAGGVGASGTPAVGDHRAAAAGHSLPGGPRGTLEQGERET
eukprot:358280-Chlamydomonas_euryale.AAC.2